jgi:hypothetical protein
MWTENLTIDTALHEVRHALVCEAVGFEVRCVALVPDAITEYRSPLAPSNLEVQYNQDPTATRLLLLQELAVLLAGDGCMSDGDRGALNAWRSLWEAAAATPSWETVRERAWQAVRAWLALPEIDVASFWLGFRVLRLCRDTPFVVLGDDWARLLAQLPGKIPPLVLDAGMLERPMPSATQHPVSPHMSVAKRQEEEATRRKAAAKRERMLRYLDAHQRGRRIPQAAIAAGVYRILAGKD